MSEKQITTIYLIWLREGEWGDNELMAARATEEGAKSWCNDHRKLTQNNPIQWHISPVAEWDYGTGTKPVIWGTSDGSDHRQYNYSIESMPLGE